MRTSSCIEIQTVSLTGLNARLVPIQVLLDQAPGTFQVLGVSEASARETRVRVRAALQQLGIGLHQHGLRVTLGSVEERHVGGGLDLAIAVAILVAIERAPVEAAQGIVFVGELSLTGALRPVRGALPMLQGAAALGIRRFIVPVDNAREASNVAGIQVLLADHLVEVGPAGGAAAEAQPATSSRAAGSERRGDEDEWLRRQRMRARLSPRRWARAPLARRGDGEPTISRTAARHNEATQLAEPLVRAPARDPAWQQRDLGFDESAEAA